MSAAPTAWDRHATWWQDGFTEGRDAEYTELIVPLAAELLAGADRVLDIGTGEGQLARVAARQGSTVVGVDPTAAQVRRGRERAGGPSYVQAPAEALPVRTASCDAVLACLVFEHIEDATVALAEVGRALAPGGRFVLFLNHPLVQTPDSGWIDDQILDPPEKYWRIGDYLTEVSWTERVDAGVDLPFVHRPLSAYVNALTASGLVLTGMREPAPPPDVLADVGRFPAALGIPRLLVIEAERR